MRREFLEFSGSKDSKTKICFMFFFGDSDVFATMVESNSAEHGAGSERFLAFPGLFAHCKSFGVRWFHY